MKITYHIDVVGSNSCGTTIDCHCSGKGNSINYTLAHMKVSNELHKLMNEELFVSIASLQTLINKKK